MIRVHPDAASSADNANNNPTRRRPMFANVNHYHRPAPASVTNVATGAVAEVIAARRPRGR